MNWETLLCFGDSITAGARSYFGYPEFCCKILLEKMKKDWNVINYAYSGFTAIDLTRHIDKSFYGLKGYSPSIITVLIGTNDVKQNTDPAYFETAFKLLLVKLKLIAANNNVLAIKLPRITTNVFYPYNYSMNNNIIEFNRIIEQIAIKNHLRTFEFHLEDDDYFDGVHFNEKGSLRAGTQLAGFILKDKGHENSSTLS